MPAEALNPAFIAANRGKRSVSLDVHSELGFAVVTRLLEKADVFLSNYRESFLKSIGLDYETLRGHGFTDEDIWNIGAITALFALSNRMANLLSMRPNDEFYCMGR